MSQTPDKLNEELSKELRKVISRVQVDMLNSCGGADGITQEDEDLVEEAVAESLAAITAAYAEAVNEVIGSDEQHAAYTDNNEAYNGSVFTRNHLRAEQRQRLQGLLPNGKDE